MGERNKILSGNLYLLYVSTAIGIGCAVAAVIPIINILALIGSIVATVMGIVAYIKLAPLHQDYMYALIAMVIGFVAGLFDHGLLDVVSSVANLFQVYFLIRATNRFLREIGREDVVEQGDQLWKLTVGITVAWVAVMLVMLVLQNWIFSGILGAALVTVAIILLVLSIALLVIRLSYFKTASQAF